MRRLVLILLLLTSAAAVPAQMLQDVRIVTADDPPYVQAESGRLQGGLVVARLYRVLDKLGISRSRIQVLPWSPALQEARTRPGTLIIFPMLPLAGLDGSLYAAFAKGTPIALVEAFRQAAAEDY